MGYASLDQASKIKVLYHIIKYKKYTAVIEK